MKRAIIVMATMGRATITIRATFLPPALILRLTTIRQRLTGEFENMDKLVTQPG